MPTGIDELLAVFCSWGSLDLVSYPLAPMSDILVLGFKVIGGVDPTELT